DTVMLICDAHWFTEAIGNIVKNALDHTKAGSTIQVSWREFTSMVQIVVKDDGSGIHPEDLPHIFKRFYRSRFSQDVQGVGLGLSLAKTIVEAHSGTIEADSYPGGGTTFTISFLISASE
ncbi:MAG: sensor histidine kinase, partial [Blautia hydrogenotrophica]